MYKENMKFSTIYLFEMISMITEGTDKKEYVEIMDFAEICFNVKEKTKKGK